MRFGLNAIIMLSRHELHFLLADIISQLSVKVNPERPFSSIYIDK